MEFYKKIKLISISETYSNCTCDLKWKSEKILSFYQCHDYEIEERSTEEGFLREIVIHGGLNDKDRIPVGCGKKILVFNEEEGIWYDDADL
jgi:hypothetical protein